jgi:hypothetical protein
MMTDADRGPGRPKGSRGSKYSWIEQEVLVKVIAPKIEQTVARHNPQSYKALKQAMEHDWQCSASVGQVRDWMKALGYELQKVTHLISISDGEVRGNLPPDLAGPAAGTQRQQDVQQMMPPAVSGRRPGTVQGVGGIVG